MLINPETLLSRIQQVERNYPSWTKEELEKANLKKLNTENLQKGKDANDMDMPIYASEDYANFKISINPRNRGFWDLRVHGDYYEGIKVTIYPAVVFFKQTNSGEKYTWLADNLEFWNNEPLGLSEERWAEVQNDMKPNLRAKIEKVISGV